MKKHLFILWVFFQSLPSDAQVAEDWVRTYDGTSGSTDQVYALARDQEGNVYVTGSSLSAGPGTEDFITIKYSLTGTAVWTSRYDGKGFGQDIATAIAVDGNGYVYVTGTSWISGSDFDYVTIKYDPFGDTVWTRRYNGPKARNDKPQAICVDANGNVYVTGLSEGSSGTHGLFEDYATICYSPGGVVNWLTRYNGLAGDYDAAVSVALDELGFVYVAGTSDNGSSGSGDPHFDYTTVKYDTAGGIIDWTRSYNGTANGDDEAVMMKIDTFGNAIITGRSTGTATSSDFLTVRYDPAGDTLWTRRLSSLGSNDDEPFGLAADDSGNVIVTGKYYNGSSPGWDIATVKYSRGGDQRWMKTYDSPSASGDEGRAVTTDSIGNVFVTGSSAGPDAGVITLKYDGAGAVKWGIGYTGGGDAWPVGIVADNAENVWVAGSGYFTSLDYLTVKYKKAPVGIAESGTGSRNFEIRPNPCGDYAEIIPENLPDGTIHVRISDLTGKLLLNLTGANDAGREDKMTIETSHLKSGIYFVVLESNGYYFSKKLLVSR